MAPRPSDSSPNRVLTRVEPRGAGRVAYVTVDNPDKRNALGLEGKRQLALAFRQLARDKLLRVAVSIDRGLAIDLADARCPDAIVNHCIKNPFVSFSHGIYLSQLPH